MKSKSINIPLYGMRLHLVSTEDFQKDREEINKKYYQNFAEEDTFLGFAERRAGHCLVIINLERHKKIFKAKWQEEVIDTISHEAFHTVSFLSIEKGIKPDLNNDEPQAYLQGFITKEIFKICK